MAGEFRFSRKTNQYNNTDNTVKCAECLEEKELSEVESDGFKYICHECDNE